jgi:hypothetical protein
VAARDPIAVGAKVTLMVQLPFAATVAGDTGQLFVCAKSPALVPVMVIPLMVSAALPLFVSVTVCAALVVFIGWLPNGTEVGVRETPGLDAVP